MRVFRDGQASHLRGHDAGNWRGGRKQVVDLMIGTRIHTSYYDQESGRCSAWIAFGIFRTGLSLMLWFRVALTKNAASPVAHFQGQASLRSCRVERPRRSIRGRSAALLGTGSNSFGIAPRKLAFFVRSVYNCIPKQPRSAAMSFSHWERR